MYLLRASEVLLAIIFFSIILFNSPFEHNHHYNDDYSNSNDSNNQKCNHGNDSGTGCFCSVYIGINSDPTHKKFCRLIG